MTITFAFFTLLIKRAFEDPVVLEALSLEQFMGRLLIGETPEKKREIAYNAYRAVDDAEEQAFIKSLEEEAKRRYGDGWLERLSIQDQVFILTPLRLGRLWRSSPRGIIGFSSRGPHQISPRFWWGGLENCIA